MTANNFFDIETGFVNSKTAADLSKPPVRMSIHELKLYKLRKTLVEHNPARAKAGRLSWSLHMLNRSCILFNRR